MWSNFEQSPVEDETISNSFSSRGIFKIRSDEEVSSYPRVQACVHNGKMIVAIDKTLLLLESELVAKCSFLSFNAAIDVVTMSSSANLIVCGLSNGEIHGIFIKGIPLFNFCVKSEDTSVTGSGFCNIQQHGQCFYLCCTNGSVYSLSKIDESPLENYLNVSISDVDVALEEAFNGVEMQRLAAGRTINDLTAAVLMPDGCSPEKEENTMCIAGSSSAMQFRCTATQNFVKSNLPKQFEGVKHIYNLDNNILVLTNSGHLIEVCPFTKFIFSPQNQNAADLLIDEIILMECSADIIELLVLTKVSEDGDRAMKFIEYPSFKCSNELYLPHHAWLVQQPKCAVNLYYVSGKEPNALGIPTEIEMVLVSETHPSERFKKLIAKGHLQEAEEFGKQFELCLQPIFEAKAKRLLMEISTLYYSNSLNLDVHFAELLELLGQIESKTFFKNNRMFNLPSRSLLEKYLEEMLKHFDEEEDEYDVLNIIEQMHRLGTLAIIDPFECNMEWQDFVYSSNLVKTITNFLKTDIPTASLIWRRHSSTLIPHLDENELQKLLTLIPNNTEAFNLVLWLRQFVPTVSSTHPGVMPFITEWSIQKTRTLQYANDWPDIGLEFVRKVTEIFEELEFMHSDIRRQYERNIAKLIELVNSLEDLTVLKKTYNLIFTLDQYCQESMDETALCILQRVQLRDLKSLVENFLNPIFQEKGKSPVTAIRMYIATLVANRHILSTWLERAVTCIELLHHEDDRFECALLVLQNCPVPWPSAVDSLSRLRKSTHPQAVQINAEYEMQVIKIMKERYGWPADKTLSLNLHLLMGRIVKMNLDSMVDDIRILTKAAPEIATSAIVTCCRQLVRRGNINTAYAFYKALKADKNPKQAEHLTDCFAKLLENTNYSQGHRERHELLLEFFKLICDSNSSTAQKRYKFVERRQRLYYDYGIHVKDVTVFNSVEACRELLQEGVLELEKRTRGSTDEFGFILRSVKYLSNILDIPQTCGLVRICKVLQCLPLTCGVAYNMLELFVCTPENVDDFIELGVELLLQQIQMSHSQYLSRTLTLLDFDPLAYPLAYELLVRAALVPVPQPQRAAELREILKYVRIVSGAYDLHAIDHYYKGRDAEINETINKCLRTGGIEVDDELAARKIVENSFEEKPVKEKKPRLSIFDDMEMTKQPKPKNQFYNHEHIPTIRFVSRTLLVMVLETIPTNSILRGMRESISSLETGLIECAREDFFVSLEQLIKTKQHHIWCVMAQYLVEYQQMNKCNIVNKEIFQQQMKRVYRTIMSSNDVNFGGLFAMLKQDEYAEAIMQKLEMELRGDQQRANFLTLAEQYYSYTGDTKKQEMIRATRLRHYYYMEFCKLNPNLKGKFNADMDSIEHLLKELQDNHVDSNLLKRMTEEFGLDHKQMLVTQILNILRSQPLKFDVKTDAFGVEELVMLTTVDDLMKLCLPYINQIENTELLSNRLKAFISEINVYFYEMYLCVIEILSILNEPQPQDLLIWTNILEYLKHKMVNRRPSRPNQMELDLWQKSQSEVAVLPKIARYRLPFLPIVEQPLKDILENELTVNTCVSWFPLIEMHRRLKESENDGLRDYFCMSVVKNFITDYKLKDEPDKWHLQPTNNAFLKSVLRLVNHMHSAVKAFTILYFVSNYAPQGADQVEAAYECYKFGLKHEAEIMESTRHEILDKIKRRWPILKTQHLLHVYNLAHERLTALVDNPRELIYGLYHSDEILRPNSKLDINMVVMEIAELHTVEVETIHYQLLQKWLSFTMDSADGTVTAFDETFMEEQANADTSIEDPGHMAENITRANYILNSWPKKKAIQFLVAHIFSTDGTANPSKQLHIYECFAKLNDGSPSCNKLNQRQYIAVKCVHELKKVGYNYSLSKFPDCNKIDILKTIWRHAQNPNMLELMANICLGFNINIPKVWNGILKGMVSHNMVRDLNALVDVLSCQPKMLHSEGLTIAWQYVLAHPFITANKTPSSQQEEILNKTLFRLQSCPVVHKLNLLHFIERMQVLERPHLIAMMIGFAKSSEQRAQIKKLVPLQKRKLLRKDILELDDAGILPAIINFVLKELEL